MTANTQATSNQEPGAKRSAKRSVRTGKRYRTGRAATHYDVIVIGSGIGGLCTAALLAKAGKKVCVLEQHYTAGGYTHSYENAGYEWDVGVHYIGEVHKRWSILRRIFDVISDGNIKWAAMNKCYDRIILGDETFNFVAGKDNFISGLVQHFPDEEKAIRDYVALLQAVSSKVPLFFAGQALPFGIAKLYNRLRPRFFPAYFFQTTRQVLETFTRNEKLIGVLTGQWGDYGLPPCESSFLMHAMVAKHYLAGAAYPVGGSWAIAQGIIPVIQAAGGEVFTYAGVEQVLVTNGQAVGVRLNNGDEILASQVVSNTGYWPTVNKLLPEAAKPKFAADKMTIPLSSAHLCLYAGFKGDAKALGLDSTNLWIYPNADHDTNVKKAKASNNSEFPLIYISFPSTKDPKWDENYPNKSTVEIVTTGSLDQFMAWTGTQWSKRGDNYDALKQEISERLLEILYQHRPQLRDALDFSELSTPLSTQWFQWNEVGEIYGLDHTPARFKQTKLHPQTPIKNLYLTGSDVVTAGVGGALMGGVMAATRMLGWQGYKIGRLLKPRSR
ncbi:NAD(P)/FAD-dependent oxidoreductase [Simiduia curdlanivorans]|uniref:Phytoene desaturase family protein n=1 Tax=Simiduia curdlanivorans TaxID=1492769 RepID=A0ABV8V3I4_9GAMM|nr:NAD(P)/FAD-dependent oxidoreductase [Simiduia curdlanivorans]MDN3640198.1 NAD(P)/FAD-dependent oxidoreductase [Simiduia curdlanivorans]